MSNSLYPQEPSRFSHLLKLAAQSAQLALTKLPVQTLVVFCIIGLISCSVGSLSLSVAPHQSHFLQDIILTLIMLWFNILAIQMTQSILSGQSLDADWLKQSKKYLASSAGVFFIFILACIGVIIVMVAFNGLLGLFNKTPGFFLMDTPPPTPGVAAQMGSMMGRLGMDFVFVGLFACVMSYYMLVFPLIVLRKHHALDAVKRSFALLHAQDWDYIARIFIFNFIGLAIFFSSYALLGSIAGAVLFFILNTAVTLYETHFSLLLLHDLEMRADKTIK